MQRALLWQDGELGADASIQSIQNTLQDPDTVMWLDLMIENDREKYTSLLHNVLKFSHLTLESIMEEKERSKLTQGNGLAFMAIITLVQILYFKYRKWI